MANNEILEKIRKEIKAFEEKKKNLVEELRKEFPKLLLPLLEKSQHIETISWTQYTPYFNDGDTCEFSAHVDDLEVNDEYEWDLPMYKEILSVRIKDETGILRDKEITEQLGQKYFPRKIGEFGKKYNLEYNKEEGQILKDIKSILREIPEDFLKDLFGDHAKVIVTKNGEITVEDCEHD